METVSVFTDTYLPTVNGVTYTVKMWRDRWVQRGGEMPIVYPDTNDYRPAAGEAPVPSFSLPFYEGFRVGLPAIPASLPETDVVHVHGPFSVGFAGLRMARRDDLPVVASYHTPLGEYTRYLAPHPRLASAFRRVGEWWERTFLEHTDVILAPSEATKEYINGRIQPHTPIKVLSNGVDTERFQPTGPEQFLQEHDVSAEKPLIGYTGRHGHEKRLHELIDAAAGFDATLVLGGDGPARKSLEQRAAARDVDVQFLGFLDRDELPAFYSSLDVFALPSTVETEGLVALEAMACGTPVVGARNLALKETITDGETGYHFESGNIKDFRRALQNALDDDDGLHEACLEHRKSISVERTVDKLEQLYDSLQ